MTRCIGYRASASRILHLPLGLRAGRKVLSLQYAASRAAPMPQPLCANAHGFSLHAGVRCAAEQRSGLEHLCRYITRPRLHLIRFHGVLAPHAKLRAAIVPIPAQTTPAHAADCDHAHGARARLTWARLLKRVFDFDVERCGCGGKLRIIAAIEEPAVIERILTHLGLSAQSPPRAPARRFDLFQAA